LTTVFDIYHFFIVFAYRIVMKHINLKIERRAMESNQEDDSVLGKFMAKDSEPKLAVLMVLDLIGAGVDTVRF
jgi:hypothetical protein